MTDALATRSNGAAGQLAPAPLDSFEILGPLAAHVRVVGDCWEWTGSRLKGGYGWYRRQYVHRLAYVRAYGPLADGQMACHRCDNPPCIRPLHLFAGTQFDNMRDMVAKGRHYAHVRPERVARGERHGSRTHPEALLRGEANPAHRLTTAEVIEIRRRHSAGETQTDLAIVFGVSVSTVNSVVLRNTWRHVKGS